MGCTGSAATESTAAPFSIPAGDLTFLVGGGSGYGSRVVLYVAEPGESPVRVYSASGRNSETMQRVVWDLTPYVGKKGMTPPPPSNRRARTSAVCSRPASNRLRNAVPESP
jgi:hypothetical protein